MSDNQSAEIFYGAERINWELDQFYEMTGELEFRTSQNHIMNTSIDLLMVSMNLNPEFSEAGQIHATLESNTQNFSVL